jgi:hypothetical protein
MRLKALLIGGALALATASPAFAVTVVYTAVLSGPNESPANASPGTGSATVTFDLVANTMDVNVIFAGLSAANTASHIHCCTAVAGTGTAGVATTTPTFTGFPSGVTSGTYDHTFDMLAASSYNPSFVTAHTDVAGAYSFLRAGIGAGKAYLNIHTPVFPGGEIRGFLQPVPEPETYALMLVGLGAIGWMSRRSRVG